MGHPNQRSKQVEGDKIGSYVSALDGALHQRINRSLDLAARALEELRRASDETIQCGGYDLLRRNVVNEQQHPGSQCLNRRHCLGELALRRSQLFHFTPIDRFDQGVSGGKVTVQGSRAHFRLFGDLVQAGIRTKTCKRLLRYLQNTLAVSLRIRARLSGNGL